MSVKKDMFVFGSGTIVYVDDDGNVIREVEDDGTMLLKLMNGKSANV